MKIILISISLILLNFYSCKETIGENKIESKHRVPKNIMPTLGCWFWTEAEFKPGGFKPFIDKVSLNSPYNYLTTSIRAPKIEVTDSAVHDQIKSAAKYARAKGVPIVMDLDVRLAREAFKSKYPDELQEMLILQEVKLSDKINVETVIRSIDLGDHYTHRTTNYIPLKGAMLRVYSYERNSNGIEPKTLKEITDNCKVIFTSKDSVRVQIPKDKKYISSLACVMVSFTHLTPDVFAPHLIDFQRQIINQYADTPLAGVCKDEWGFPPSFDGNPEKNQFWYSKHRASAYAKKTNGRDLLSDCLLMYAGINGQEDQRILAINNFMEMSWQRNGEVENDFYNVVKEVFGSKAIVATHPTWWPYPDLREFKKNGLDWWVAKRDWAQTDELTPFAVRTALSKKWSSPFWYNMYYSKDITDYERSVWSFALGGGRINYHQPYPAKSIEASETKLLHGDLMKAESRVRLLNFISESPLDCPVAVVFGHASAMNWAGKGFNDVGMEVADNLWAVGYPADLIPSSEIDNKNLYIDKDGWICYGPQRYSAVVFYNPEFEKPSTTKFLNKAAKGSTKMFKIGEWTHYFNGRTTNGNPILPKAMIESSEIKSVIPKIIDVLQTQNILPQTPATSHLEGFGHISNSPQATGLSRLIDGTIIQIAGTNTVTGDPIQSMIKIHNYDVTFDAIGVAAVRLDNKGELKALAAGGLNYFKVGKFELKLNERVDIAIWKDQHNKWQGVLQGWKGTIPTELLSITKNWLRLDVPIPL